MGLGEGDFRDNFGLKDSGKGNKIPGDKGEGKGKISVDADPRCCLGDGVFDTDRFGEGESTDRFGDGVFDIDRFGEGEILLFPLGLVGEVVVS